MTHRCVQVVVAQLALHPGKCLLGDFCAVDILLTHLLIWASQLGEGALYSCYCTHTVLTYRTHILYSYCTYATVLMLLYSCYCTHATVLTYCTHTVVILLYSHTVLTYCTYILCSYCRHTTVLIYCTHPVTILYSYYTNTKYCTHLTPTVLLLHSHYTPTSVLLLLYSYYHTCILCTGWLPTGREGDILLEYTARAMSRWCTIQRAEVVVVAVLVPVPVRVLVLLVLLLQLALLVQLVH
jgi:hypothetical protein